MEVIQPDVIMTWLWFWDHRYTAPGLLYDEAHAYCNHNVNHDHNIGEKDSELNKDSAHRSGVGEGLGATNTGSSSGSRCKIVTWTDDAHGARQRQLGIYVYVFVFVCVCLCLYEYIPVCL